VGHYFHDLRNAITPGHKNVVVKRPVAVVMERMALELVPRRSHLQDFDGQGLVRPSVRQLEFGRDQLLLCYVGRLSSATYRHTYWFQWNSTRLSVTARFHTDTLVRNCLIVESQSPAVTGSVTGVPPDSALSYNFNGCTTTS